MYQAQHILYTAHQELSTTNIMYQTQQISCTAH